MSKTDSLRHELGQLSNEELRAARDAIETLKGFRAKIGPTLSRPIEFFEPNHKLDPGSRKSKTAKIKFYNQNSLCLSILVQHEYRLKNLSVIDGYILAVENTQPMAIYLMARYSLELLATVNLIIKNLEKALATDLRDWQGRGNGFLSYLCQARYAASDPKITGMLKSFGVSASAVKPIDIMLAIRELSLSDFAPSAGEDYDFLSNICHHNGSSHELFRQSLRQTTSVITPAGQAIILRAPSPAVTLNYPSETAQRVSMCQTALLVLACTAHTDRLLAEMPSVPFSEDEVAELTDGEVSNSLNYFSPESIKEVLKTPTKHAAGRNEPCPCGSGKKYKRCCLN
jgi:uncharacterized protein YchJ